MNKVGPTAELIGSSFENWLVAEVNTSSTQGDVNTYLNDFTTAREGITGGYDHPKNYSAIKLRSHIDRLAFWFNIFEQEPTDEEIAAKLIFAGLMQLSGTYRNQSYLEAKNAPEYAERRSKGIGIDTAAIVQNRLDLWTPSGAALDQVTITSEDLGKKIESVSKVGEIAVRRISMRGVWKYDLGETNSISSQYMQFAQKRWLEYTTDALILAAKNRGGDLTKVPFWEPKSISSTPPPKIKYPLDPSFVGWNESAQ